MINKNDEQKEEIKEEINRFIKFLVESFELDKSVYAIITSSQVDQKWTTWKFQRVFQLNLSDENGILDFLKRLSLLDPMSKSLEYETSFKD